MYIYNFIIFSILFFLGNDESVMDFTDDLTKLKIRKSQFNLSVSLTPGELTAIFDSPTTVQPKLNGTTLIFCYLSLKKKIVKSIKIFIFFVS